MDIQAWTQESTEGFVGVMEKRMGGRDTGRAMEGRMEMW